MVPRSRIFVLFTALSFGCSDGDDDNKVDAGPQDSSAGQGTLSGTIKDSTGSAVGDAVLKVAGATVPVDWQGKYEVVTNAGNVTVEVTAPWFQDKSQQQEVVAAQTTTLDITLDAKVLQVLAADKTLADTYTASFDWTTDKTSIPYVPKPTRAKIDLALYYHNPALFEDTSGETPITPATPPTINGGASGFDFEIPAGADHAGEQALDGATIVDAIGSTPLTTAEQADDLLWYPAVKIYLRGWDLNKSLNLEYAGIAVESQKWGSNTIHKPQHIEQVYLHNNEVWVKVVFANWVNVGAGITDTDGDGHKEVWAKIRDLHVHADTYTELSTIYVGRSYTTLELKDELGNILDDLYETSNPEIVSYLGTPYEVTGAGTVQYPFVVLRHSGGEVNVLLVEGS